MSDEFDVYNNLNLIRECNLATEVRAQIASNFSNDCENVDDSFDDFESMVSNNSVKTATVAEEKTKKNKAQESEPNVRTRRSVSANAKSISQPLRLLGNDNNVLNNCPANVSNVSDQTLNAEGSTQNVTSKRGRVGRGRVRGRGLVRGRARERSSNTNNTLIVLDSLNESCNSEHRSDSQQSVEHLSQAGSGHLSAMRNRRRCVAEMAARCVTVDTIDLVSSPFPRVEGMINLVSDEEEECPQTSSMQKTVGESMLDTSLNDENPELTVKINWKCKPERMVLRKYQKFSTLFKLFAEREGTAVENIVLNLNERIISPDDTPDSVGYKFFHFINGRVMIENTPVGTIGVPKKQRNPNEINLKIQSDKWKKPLQINIMKSDKLRILYIKCAEDLNVPVQQIKLSFDGDQLDPNATPADFELEGGEAIDLQLKT